jgi:hypothetical protein
MGKALKEGKNVKSSLSQFVFGVIVNKESYLIKKEENSLVCIVAVAVCYGSK